MKTVEPVPCQHIADYYAHRQAENPSIGNNLLRRGYQQFANGSNRISTTCSARQ